MRTAHKATAAGVLVAAGVMYAGYEGTGPRVPNQPVPTVRAYNDGVGVTTICFGETRAVRPDLKMGDTDTLANCKARLPLVLKKFDDGLKACLNIDIPDGMHVVLISTTANIGIAAFCHSSMARLINEGNLVGACHALRAWNMAGGKPMLDSRRRKEEHDCLKGIRDDQSPITANKDPPPWNTSPLPSPSSASLPSLSSSTSSAGAVGAGPVLPSKSAPPSAPKPTWLNRLLHWLLPSFR